MLKVWGREGGIICKHRSFCLFSVIFAGSLATWGSSKPPEKGAEDTWLHRTCVPRQERWGARDSGSKVPSAFACPKRCHNVSYEYQQRFSKCDPQMPRTARPLQGAVRSKVFSY